jgi:hypothetical protein
VESVKGGSGMEWNGWSGVERVEGVEGVREWGVERGRERKNGIGNRGWPMPHGKGKGKRKRGRESINRS